MLIIAKPLTLNRPESRSMTRKRWIFKFVNSVSISPTKNEELQRRIKESERGCQQKDKAIKRLNQETMLLS